MKDSDYTVGYGRPPVHSRFVKGRSGNPAGRPKGSRNFKTDLIEELQERISVRAGESVKKISKQQALIKTMVNKALKGDIRAADIVMKWRSSEQKDIAADTEEALSTDERELLAGIEARVFPQKPQATDKAGGGDADDNGATT